MSGVPFDVVMLGQKMRLVGETSKFVSRALTLLFCEIVKRYFRATIVKNDTAIMDPLSQMEDSLHERIVCIIFDRIMSTIGVWTGAAASKERAGDEDPDPLSSTICLSSHINRHYFETRK